MKNKWKTKDGDVLFIKDMETSHIKNCIKMLKQNMPDHYDDEVIVADFPESCWHMGCVYTEYGGKHYIEKINEFNAELASRV